MLECDNLSITIGDRALVRCLDLRLRPGRLVALLGPNGAGKSLTLNTLAGLREPVAGEIRLGGTPLKALPRREVARQLGLLLQASQEIFPHSVLGTVLLGRHPHLQGRHKESGSDRERAWQALRRLDIETLADRPVTTLSGGEARRMALARLLVQDPDVMLLDEPTNHLDPLHQIGCLALLRELAAQGKSILVSLHDAVLAARFADEVLLLPGDGDWLLGPAPELLTPVYLERLYRTAWVPFHGSGETVHLPDRSTAATTRPAPAGAGSHVAAPEQGVRAWAIG